VECAGRLALISKLCQNPKPNKDIMSKTVKACVCRVIFVIQLKVMNIEKERKNVSTENKY
jgi:hypothetical protein